MKGCCCAGDSTARALTARLGFTLLEVISALLIMGILTTLGVPRLRGWITHEEARAARLLVTTRLATARATAVQRGCPADLHLDEATEQVWVTACQLGGAGLDTVGSVADVLALHGATFTSSGNLVRFAPAGLSFGSSWVDITFSKAGYDVPLKISPVGRPVW